MRLCRCEITGGTGTQEAPVQAHEVWEVDDDAGVVRLGGLQARAAEVQLATRAAHAASEAQLRTALWTLQAINECAPAFMTMMISISSNVYPFHILCFHDLLMIKMMVTTPCLSVHNKTTLLHAELLRSSATHAARMYVGPDEAGVLRQVECR